MGKHAASSMPNSAAADRLVVTAKTCWPMVDSVTPPAISHARARWALVSVSSVVKVFEQTTRSVVSGLRSRTTTSRSWGSTFEIKCVLSLADVCFSARHTMRGPRSEPPMPILMTSVKGFPVAPICLPECTASVTACMRINVSLTS